MNRTLALLLIAALIVSGCTHTTATRAPAHDGAAPVLSTNKFNWVELSFDDFLKFSQPPPFQTGPRLNAQDVVTKRLQTWADRIHVKVKNDFELQTSQPLTAPAPKVVVVPSGEASAWVSGIAVCFKVPVRVASAGLQTTKSTGLLHLEADNYYEQKSNCHELKADLHQFIAWFNSFNGKCRLEAEGAGVVIRGEDCAPRLSANEPTEAMGLQFYATSNYIHLTSALIAQSPSEEGLVSTLTHELGHYYRAHPIGMLRGKKYDYWYQQSVPPRAGLPLKLAESDRLSATLKRLMPHPMSIIEGRQFSYVLREFLTFGMYEPLKNACGNIRKCACGVAVRMLDDGWRHELSSPANPLPEETKRKYLEFERVLQTCAPSLTIPNRQEWIEAYSHSFAASFVKNLPLGDNLAVVLEALNEKTMEVDRELQEFEAGLISRRIGYYTREQEADDFSVEYTSKIGLDPLTTNLETFKQYFMPEDQSAVEVSKCLQARENGWSQPVPIGSLTDIHHGACYRLFNMDQEVLAHGWKAADEPRPVFKGTWAEVIKRAKKVTPDAILPSGPSQRVNSSGLIIN